jgi:uncharacterized protein (TIGR00369 family)
VTRDQAHPYRVDDRIRQGFTRQGLMTHLGAELIDAHNGVVTIRLQHRPELSQHRGLMHAGALSAIADTAGGFAALSLMDEGSDVLTVEYKLNLLAPADGDHVEARGTVLRSGRTLTVCQLDVWAVDGDRRTAVAVGQQTLIRTEARADA